MVCWSEGLTVSGTAMARPGTVRGPGCALAAFWLASSAAKSGAGGDGAVCAPTSMDATNAEVKTNAISMQYRGDLMGDPSLAIYPPISNRPLALPHKGEPLRPP
jgi:hypothetical protein